MTPCLAPITTPRGPRLRLLATVLRRVCGKPPSWLTVWSTRMPFAFTAWMGKASWLDKKLSIGMDTMVLVRAGVDDINTCQQCQDASRWYVTKEQPRLLPKLDALFDYRHRQLFSDKARWQNHWMPVELAEAAPRRRFNCQRPHCTAPGSTPTRARARWRCSPQIPNPGERS